MSAERFFSRWSRKAEEPAALAPADTAAAPAEAVLPPDAEALERLQPGEGVAAFMQQGVTETLKRGALRKLFSDPHFNVMDGLDIYIGDYNTPDPMPEAMLAQLNQFQNLITEPREVFEAEVAARDALQAGPAAPQAVTDEAAEAVVVQPQPEQPPESSAETSPPEVPPPGKSLP